MQTQLQEIVEEFESASRRLRVLAESIPEPLWNRRADPDRWSMSECVAHLNLTSQVYLPLVRDGLEQARAVGGHGPARYRRDLTGWMLWKLSGPPARFPAKTTAQFQPAGNVPLRNLTATFEELNAQQIAYVREADGLPIERVKITSPFNASFKYNLYSCLTILPRHQHRHLWQAEQVGKLLQPGRSSEPLRRLGSL
jgi:hypothetical protein